MPRASEHSHGKCHAPTAVRETSCFAWKKKKCTDKIIIHWHVIYNTFLLYISSNLCFHIIINNIYLSVEYNNIMYKKKKNHIFGMTCVMCLTILVSPIYAIFDQRFLYNLNSYCEWQYQRINCLIFLFWHNCYEYDWLYVTLFI